MSYQGIGMPFGSISPGAGPGCAMGFEYGGTEGQSSGCRGGGCDSDNCCGTSHWRDSVYNTLKGGQAYQYFQERAIRQALYELLDVPTPNGFPSRLDEYAYDACGADQDTPQFKQSLEALRARLKRAGFNFWAILDPGRWYTDATGTRTECQTDGWYSKRRVRTYDEAGSHSAKDCMRQDGGWIRPPGGMLGIDKSDPGLPNPCIGGPPTANKTAAVFNVTSGKPATFWRWWEDTAKPLVRTSPVTTRTHGHGWDPSGAPEWKAADPRNKAEKYTGYPGPAAIAAHMLTCGPATRAGGACSGCEVPPDRWAAQHGGDPGNRVAIRDMGNSPSMRWWARFLDVFAPLPDVGGPAPKLDPKYASLVGKLVSVKKKREAATVSSMASVIGKIRKPRPILVAQDEALVASVVGAGAKAPVEGSSKVPYVLGGLALLGLGGAGLWYWRRNA